MDKEINVQPGSMQCYTSIAMRIKNETVFQRLSALGYKLQIIMAQMIKSAMTLSTVRDGQLNKSRHSAIICSTSTLFPSRYTDDQPRHPNPPSNISKCQPVADPGLLNGGPL